MAIPIFDIIRPHQSVDVTGKILTAVTTEWTNRCAQAASDKKSAGKWYFEISIDVSMTAPEWIAIGLTQASLITIPGYTAASCSYVSYDLSAKRMLNSVERVHGPDWSRGVPLPIIIGVAYDATSGKVYFSSSGLWRRNYDAYYGSATLDEANDVAGVLTPGWDTWPAVGLPYAGQVVHANFAADELVYSPPSGFSSWEIVDPNINGYLEIINDICLGSNMHIRIDDAIDINGSLMIAIRSTLALYGDLRVRYEDANKLLGDLEIAYNSFDKLSGELRISCDILNTKLEGSLGIIYDVSDSNLIFGNLLVSIPDDATSNLIVTPPVGESGDSGDNSGITINGVPIMASDMSIRFGIDSYVGSCDLELISLSEFVNINEFDTVDIDLYGTMFNFKVLTKDKSESVSDIGLKVECKSPAFIMDFPYADVVDKSLFPNLASTIFDTITSQFGITSEWLMLTDEVIDIDSIDSSSSPLVCLRTIVNEMGGILQSRRDGSFYAAPKRLVNPEDYPSTGTTKIIDLYRDVESIESSTEKNTEYNKFLVFNETLSNSYDLQYESISDSSGLISAYRVPWDGVFYPLFTSEHTNVSIQYQGVVETSKTEEIEIKNGAGSLSLPCYNITSTNYKDRDNLGALSFTEDGSVTTALEGNTMVQATYTTKCFRWSVSDMDSESVQFYLGEG